MIQYLEKRNNMHNLQSKDIPKTIPRTHSQIGRCIGSFILKVMGWRIEGAFPNDAKFIAAVAPHTSNWDFVIAIAVKLKLDIKIQFLGKHTIFIGPFGYLLKKMGGIAVDRSAAHGVVGQITQQFNQQDALILGLAPEGTRKYAKKWKTGFLYMANAASVPVVPMKLDYSSKTFTVLPALNIDGNIESELKRYKELFPKEVAKYPHQVSD
jgi:1-acyl-sn-glycerol-3-phosphate acyltransferase